MTLPTGTKRADPRRAGNGFTLIELILVMALLVMVVSLVTPQLAGFFRGRTLENEARRLMTLTRYGQNRAVAEGVPMLLWMDEQNRRYGLEAQPGYRNEADSRAIEYILADRLEIQVGAPLSAYATTTRASAQTMSLPTKLRYIRFTPDGFLGEGSPEMIRIRLGEKDFLTLGPGRNGRYYEVYTNTSLAAR